MYDWMPFFKELAEKVKGIGDSSPLREEAKTIFGEDFPLIKWPMDPFTFIYVIASRKSDGNLNDVKSCLELTAQIPTDKVFPTPPGQASRGFHANGDFAPLSVEGLWIFFKAILDDSDGDTVKNLFPDVLSIKNVGVSKLTQVLFLINPEKFIPIDKHTECLFPGKSFAELERQSKEFSGYMSLKDVLKKTFPGTGLHELNRLAYAASREGLARKFSLNWYQISSQQNGEHHGDYIDDWYEKSHVAMGYNQEGQTAFDDFSELKKGTIFVVKKGMLTMHGIAVALNDDLSSEEGDGPTTRDVIWMIKDPKQEVSGFAIGTLSKISDGSKVHVAIEKKYPEFLEFFKSIANKGATNMTEENGLLAECQNLLEANKNLVLTGAPGTGKTWHAKRIANAITGTEDGEDSPQIEFAQFHPSYDYTDFVEGLRPIQKAGESEICFERRDGIFKAFCQKAREDEESRYVFIIDEINRAEISKVFGELFFAIDPGYRGKGGAVQTQYGNMGGEDENSYAPKFYVPENVYILATMNDIDRSVETFDFAMRRRFAWRAIRYGETLSMLDGYDWTDEAKKRIENLNKAIEGIEELGPSYHVGASYFLKLNDYDGDFSKLWKLHVEVLLKEYLRGLPEADAQLEKLEKAYNRKPAGSPGEE